MVEIRIISLGLTLDDIPVDEDPCYSCHAPVHKEFLDFDRLVGSMRVLVVPPVPGYGCIGCGLKHYEPGVAAQLFRT